MKLSALFGKSTVQPTKEAGNQAELAAMALNTIADGVLIISGNGIIKYANPAAATMTGYANVGSALGLDYLLVLKLENKEGGIVDEQHNPLVKAIKTNTALESRDFLLSSQNERKMAIALSILPTGGPHADKIIIFRDITKELEEESSQMEFISTASHEMRTPVASIEGYLGLAMNPQTATIDARARQYLNEAHQASQHLGRLFQDLLDVTKLDDGRLKPRLVPVEVFSNVKQIANAHLQQIEEKKLKYIFGTPDVVVNEKRVEQMVYAMVDVDFLREVIDNLIDNAVKYTPAGGEIWVNVRGDSDRVLINVTDTGMGIGPEDLTHIFQKFYRVDNSQTQTIGGTGLGLYLVKSRVEAMSGRVWAESSFGDGTTFYVSLPRLSPEEYEKRKLIMQNEQTVQNFSTTPIRGKMVTSNVPQIQPAKTAVAATQANLTPATVRTVPNIPVVKTPVSQQPSNPAPPIAAATSASVPGQATQTNKTKEV